MAALQRHHSACHSAHGGAAEQWCSTSQLLLRRPPTFPPPGVVAPGSRAAATELPAGRLAVPPPLSPQTPSPHLVRSHPALVQLQQNCLPAALQRHHALGQGLGPRRKDHECGTGLKQREDLWGGEKGGREGNVMKAVTQYDMAVRVPRDRRHRPQARGSSKKCRKERERENVLPTCSTMEPACRRGAAMIRKE